MSRPRRATLNLTINGSPTSRAASPDRTLLAFLREDLGLTALPVLVIDDLGIGRDTEFAFQTLYEIVDGRYMAMKGGLIVTSNLSLDDLAAKLGDDRIPSRLASMCKVIRMTGADKRVK